ncbi:tRNA(His) guanylyltransferase Thg1 family protein [Undibacterium sp. Ji50W]|uniref:tRNA(His) guanylyltransferase Thg1 family protein n=1 Tax=Undibacterium sp. Ji50W TaxID=3413041 RepID=UPI003BF0CFD8
MKFDELEKVMRAYETAHDDCVPVGTYMVARIDGRGFTRLTKETCAFEAPFDIKFRDLMVETCKHLMNCGFKVVYAHNQSDEISLLFDLNINAFWPQIEEIQFPVGRRSFRQIQPDAGSGGCFRLPYLPITQLKPGSGLFSLAQ